MALFKSHKCTVHGSAASSNSFEDERTLPANPSATALTSTGNPQTVAEHVLRRAVPTLAIMNMEIHDSPRVQHDFLLRLVDSRRMMFSLDPVASVKLLRYERESVASEGALLEWLNSLPSFKSHDQPPTRFGMNPAIQKQIRVLSKQYKCSTFGRRKALNYLGRHTPSVHLYGLRCSKRQTPSFSLKTPSKGFDLTTLGRPLSNEEEISIEWQSGQFLRRTASHTSPTGKFGHALDILSSKVPPTYHSIDLTERPSSNGFAMWSQAFHVLLEEILRDLEDFWVQIPYDRVREEFQRLRHLLDGVKRPSLLLVEGAEACNLLVTPRRHNADCHNRIAVSIQGDSGGEEYPGRLKLNVKVKQSTPPNLKITGLRDWSNCLFGDPLLASKFAGRPNPYFIKGAYSPFCTSDPFLGASLIEDHEHSESRRLLYECYHCLVGIAKCYSRPRNSMVDMELHWRKRLLDVLGRISKIDEDGKPVKC